MTWLDCCKLFWWFCYADAKDNICLISISNLYELFSAFICANNIESLAKFNLFGVKNFNPFSPFTSSPSLSLDSSLSYDSSFSNQTSQFHA